MKIPQKVESISRKLCLKEEKRFFFQSGLDRIESSVPRQRLEMFKLES